jgi:uncharacterized protein YbjT (DUF2867 family)
MTTLITGANGTVAAHILADPTPHAARTYTITGPNGLSFAEAAKELGVRYHALTRAEALAAMRQGGMDDQLASMGLEYATAFAEGWGDRTTTDFADTLGRRPRSFTQFAHERSARDSDGNAHL